MPLFLFSQRAIPSVSDFKFCVILSVSEESLKGCTEIRRSFACAQDDAAAGAEPPPYGATIILAIVGAVCDRPLATDCRPYGWQLSFGVIPSVSEFKIMSHSER